MPPRIAIILVNWNGQSDTLECLASLRRDRYENKWIIVVDNGSSDGSVAAILAAEPNVEVIETGRNLGFAGGNNTGIKRALAGRADYVYVLNNDTVSEPDALSRLVEAAEAFPRYALLTPVIHYFDHPEEAWFAGSLLDLDRGIAVHDNARVPDRSEPPTPIPWASGCAMLLRADLARRLGGFDERYFLICEDVDLSLRIRAAGHAIGIVPAARICHKVHRSFKTSAAYYIVRNTLLLVRTHGRSEAYCRAAVHVLLRHFRQGLWGLREGKQNAWRDLAGTACALLDHVAGRYGRRGESDYLGNRSNGMIVCRFKRLREPPTRETVICEPPQSTVMVPADLPVSTKQITVQTRQFVWRW